MLQTGLSWDDHDIFIIGTRLTILTCIISEAYICLLELTVNHAHVP